MKFLLAVFATFIVGSQTVSVPDINENSVDEWDFELSAKELADSQWNEFKLTFNKHYQDETEELHRKKIFLENSIKSAKRNQLYAQGQVATPFGTTFFSDLTLKEAFETYGNCLRKPTNATNNHITFIPSAHVKIPEEIDWRNKGAVTPVKDQGGCGSCYSFAATGALEGQQFRKDEELVSLSEQNLVDCSKRDHGCQGGLPSNSFEYIADNDGVDTEDSYPYEADVGTCRYNPEHKGATDRGVFAIPEADEEALKAAVGTSGPVAVGIDVSNLSFYLYKEGSPVYYEPECSEENISHAVLIVGYGTDPKDPHPDYWIVKNSWGVDKWGDKGYIRMARNQGNNCGIASIAAYPLV